MSVGSKVIEQVIASKLFTVSCPDSPDSSCLVVWSANAPERLDAMLAEYEAKRRRDPCVWYCPYQVEQFKQFPDWFYRNQSQPWATLRPMVERGALRMKKVDLGGGFNVPVFLRPCCDRADEYNGFASGPLLFQCPRSCSCHD